MRVLTGYTYGDMTEGKSPNRVYAVTYNGGTEVEYAYDSLGRVEYRTLANADVQAQYHYESRSGSVYTSTRVQSVYENGVNTLYAYDEMGNIVRVEDSLGNADTYTYDSLNQLVAANAAGKAYAYTYDAGGNILTAVENGVTHTYTYGNTVWRDLLTAYDGQSITYDQIGNPLTYRNGMQFSWEHGRQLRASLNPGSSITTYTYNADGTRHSKSTQTNVTKTTTYYYVEGVLYAVESPVYTVVFQMDDTGRPYGFRLLHNDSPGYETQLYYKYNLQGDVVGIYDCVGNEVVTYTYDPWGKLLSATGVSILIDANPLLYRGYVYDKETGFYYCNSRYYDPEIGRWINADALVDQSSVLGYNLFAYCRNNPVNMTDTTGNLPFFAITAAIGAVVGAVVGGVVAAKNGGNVWAGVGIGAAAGGLAGAGLGAAAGVMLAGSATASTAAVASGAGMLATAVSTGGAGAGLALVADNISRAVNNVGTVLYSGGEQARQAATTFANNTGGTTIDPTVIGQVADAATKVPGADFTTVWSQASAAFCHQASGVVNAFVSNSAYRGVDSIFWSVEMPTLLNNPRVTEIIIHIFE